MKTLILEDDEFKLLAELIEIAHQERGSIRNGPVHTILDTLDQLSFRMDDEQKKQIREIREKARENEQKVFRVIDSLHQKITFAKTTDQ